ncbi:hypothetical protein [Culicoidibacter larvae]|uniref:Uncharacterized protein n=1 Tax=Culicoidibacter larvae TaxID=2579976 RepID=A0A5R8Q9H2_9FIRM|nr:hypothetical protein [Culicoidibacter larvae]TLG71518.1 hypothetical protein FEZ08_10510 [Culicoidibacter larvae]
MSKKFFLSPKLVIGMLVLFCTLGVISLMNLLSLLAGNGGRIGVFSMFGFLIFGTVFIVALRNRIEVSAGKIVYENKEYYNTDYTFKIVQEAIDQSFTQRPLTDLFKKYYVNLIIVERNSGRVVERLKLNGMFGFQRRKLVALLGIDYM